MKNLLKEKPKRIWIIETGFNLEEIKTVNLENIMNEKSVIKPDIKYKRGSTIAVFKYCLPNEKGFYFMLKWIAPLPDKKIKPESIGLVEIYKGNKGFNIVNCDCIDGVARWLRDYDIGYYSKVETQWK